MTDDGLGLMFCRQMSVRRQVESLSSWTAGKIWPAAGLRSFTTGNLGHLFHLFAHMAWHTIECVDLVLDCIDLL